MVRENNLNFQVFHLVSVVYSHFLGYFEDELH